MYPGSVASCGGLLEEGTYPVDKPNHKNGHQSQNMLHRTKTETIPNALHTNLPTLGGGFPQEDEMSR
jgi:hypothetical protein